MSDADRRLVEDRKKIVFEAAAKAGCSPEGHAAVVELLIINNAILSETRDTTQATHDGVQTLLRKAENNQPLWSDKPWGNKAKIGGLAGSLGLGLALAIERVLSYVFTKPTP